MIIPDRVVSSWISKVGQKQVIGQAELFPVLIARLTWQHRITGKRVYYFIDNESARLALVKRRVLFLTNPLPSSSSERMP